MNIKNLMQLIQNQNPDILDALVDPARHQGFVRALLQRTYCNLVLAELSETFDNEEKYFTVAILSALQYGVFFQRKYRKYVSHDAQYLSMSDSIFTLLTLHREGHPHEIIDCCFSRLVNQLSTFAEIKNFNLSDDVVVPLCRHSESALSEDSDSN